MGENGWILDVLVDLREVAAAKGLGRLSDQLDIALDIAYAEISPRADDNGAQSYGEEGRSRRHSGGLGCHHDS